MPSSLRPMLDCHIDSSWDLAAKMTSGVWIWNNFFSPVKILNNWFDVLSSLASSCACYFRELLGEDIELSERGLAVCEVAPQHLAISLSSSLARLTKLLSRCPSQSLSSRWG
eukprot:scaffold654_cov146-Skeletonema_marinoi.AAC.1